MTSSCPVRRSSEQPARHPGPSGHLEVQTPSSVGMGTMGGRLSVQSGAQTGRRRRSIIKGSNGGSAAPRQSRVSRAKRITIGQAPPQEYGHAAPQPPTRQHGEWQLRNDTVMNRVVSLFNCHTMSDVIFNVGMKQIPAHKFVLSAASPVLFKQLYVEADKQQLNGRNLWLTSSQAGSVIGDHLSGHLSAQLSSVLPSRGCSRAESVVSCAAGMQQPDRDVVHVQIPNHKYEDFYELLHFLYTDEVNINMMNVTALVFMSDEYKLPSLSEACLDFLRDGVRAEACLKVLSILRSLMKKAVVALWKETIERSKEMRKFKELSLADRQRRLAAIRGSTTSSQAGDSKVPSCAISRKNSGQSICVSEAAFSEAESMVSRYSRKSGDFSQGGMSNAGSGCDVSGLNKSEQAASSGQDAKTRAMRTGLYYQLALTSEELSEKCWRYIREETHIVLAGDDWVEQDQHTIKAILGLDMCSIAEARLFRALNRWAEHQCKLQGFPTLPEYRRQVIGADALQQVRFPTMTLEELQWEVVPTGLLDYQIIRHLQEGLTKGNAWIPQFNGEPRLMPLSDMTIKMQKNKDLGEQEDEHKRNTKDGKEGTGFRPGAYGGGMYVPVGGDTLDLILGARLWRSHVETFVDEQEEMGLAHEAGVPFGKETDVRPVHCGNIMAHLAQHGDAPHRRHRQLLRRPDAQSPMAMSARRKVPEPPQVQMLQKPSTAPATPGRGRPSVPRALSVQGASSPHCVRTLLTPPGHRASAVGVQGFTDDKVSLPAMPGVRRPATTDGVGPRSEEKKERERWTAMPSDFERLATGLYCFRCHELIELRLHDGDPFVFKYGPVDQRIIEEILSRHTQDTSSCSRRWTMNRQPKSPKSLVIAVDDDDGSQQVSPARRASFGQQPQVVQTPAAVEPKPPCSDEEVRQMLGVPDRPQVRGVPLDAFLYNM